jgi:outer membrane protein
MKKLSKILLILSFLTLYNQNLSAELPFYLDFKFILNESIAGKKAQKDLKNKLENGLSDISKKEKNLQSEEKKIIAQKKLISEDEYKKKVVELRKKVIDVQKSKKNLLDTVAKQRSKARVELLKNLNPVIKTYMEEKKIRYVMDKKSLILADENLDITQDIIKRLNAKIKSVKLN